MLVALLTVIALSYNDLPAWALAGALLAPVAATALLATFPLASLSVCVPTGLATAAAMNTSVPPWSVALGAAAAVVSLLAGRRIPRVAPVLVVFASGAVLVAPLALIQAEAWPMGLLMLALTVVFPWGLGRMMRQQAELAAAITERVHLRERTRIAHDMHDTLGHELSLLALRAGGLEMAPDLDEHHRAAVAELRAGAGAVTERLADIVRVLRDGEPAPRQPVPDRIEDLVDRAAQAGMTVTLEWDGPRELPSMIDRTARRVVQEALTNASKHAPGAAVRVRVAVADATTVVTVINGLPANSRRGAGGGLGVLELRERVQSAGGTLDAGPRGGTFEMVATLPHMGNS
ncbi:hypothetical protein Atai01_75460 [Amycolatopsis taiwanensis]|uniref:histidine kinase n=1 Tax=Amycolatopsis taiwanensis TaxID=342230 RepID=A0A9W6VKZ2_9PSEU|nr:hypothetical protein Atai01_75460 [Amycolatopsis taiwanensis]